MTSVLSSIQALSLIHIYGTYTPSTAIYSQMDYMLKAGGLTNFHVGTIEGYPSRLRECDDAPLALFYRGNADLNTLHIINIVGTRCV